MSFRLAIIGYGGMAGWHHKNIREKLPFIHVAGAYDIRDAAREKIVSEGIHLYESPEELYEDKDVDVVLIATPNDFHKPYSISCLEAGKNVICEKPVTLNAAELTEIQATAKRTGKFFTVHQNRRWDTDYLTVRNAVESGLLSMPYVIESRVQGGTSALHGWRGFKRNGGGMLLDWGVHLIDQMLDFVKEPLIEVSAHLHHVIVEEVDDVFAAYFRFESGLSYLVNVSINSFIPQPRWHVCSVDGTMLIENWDCDGKVVKNVDWKEQEWAENIVYTSAGPTRTMAPRPKNTLKELPLPIVKKDCFTEYYTNIDAVVNGKAEPIVKPEQSLRVMRTIDMVFEADSMKRSVACSI